ncbi:MAG TPA: 4Fe-4S binding protein, partial [Spirochaetota bacterium]|nr:4Fe-4S binding protein [Spirochaetota bacterium]
MKYLKPLRITVSLAVTISLAVIFADFYRQIPAWFREPLLYPQFIPSAVSFFMKAALTAGGFIAVIIATLFAGRLYCSFICPLGFCQDLFIRIRGMLRRKRSASYSRPHYFLFYSALSVSVLSFAFSGTILIRWLDPFSIFGRFITYGVSLPLIELNNGIASMLVKKNIFTVSILNIKPSLAGTLFACSIFMTIMTLSIFYGRTYCNTVCPAGAVLSLFSRFSIFRLGIDRSSCTRCGKCAAHCKSSCIDFRNGYIDTARCVSCFNCVSACPEKSVKFVHVEIRQTKIHSHGSENVSLKSAGITRAAFIAGLLLVPRLVFPQGKQGGTIYRQDPAKQKKYSRKSFSSPPGSVSINRFNSSCTACSLCISACPSRVLQPAVLQYGLNGIMQPYMDFNSGFCNYDCIRCGEVCPAGAILQTGIDAKRRIQTGRSVFVKENCITYTNGTDCGACSEHCPTKAVHMVPFRNNLVIPEVNMKICTGCGACEYACPVRPLRAIYVEGN